MPWNPSDKNANITLSNSDRSAEAAVASHCAVRSVESKSSGKYYFEIEITDGGTQTSVGIMTATPGLDDNIGDTYDDAWGYASNGAKFHDDVGVFWSASNFSTGRIIGVAVDIDAGKLWFARGNIWQPFGSSADPASGSEPAFEDATMNTTIYAAASVYEAKVTINQTSSECTYTPPSGFDYFEADPPQEQFSDSAASEASGSAQNLTGREADEATAGAAGSADNLTLRETDGGAAGASGTAQNFTLRLSDGGSAGASGEYNTIYNRSIGPDGGSADTSGLANITAERSLSDGGSAGAAGDIINYTEFLLQYLGIAYELFTFTLDGTEIPISTFQARFKDGDPTHLQVTIPDYVAWAATIAAATNGEMILTGTYFYGGETVLTQQILAVDVDSIDFAEGPSSKTITLKGKRTVSTTAQTAALSGAYSKQTQSGSTSYQLATIDYFLRPGDTATIGDDTITVDSITYTVSPGSAQMTVKAA